MQKKLTITIDQAVYEALYRTIGPRRISRYIESLLRPHVMSADLEAGYRAMAEDTLREAEALEWSEALLGDITDDAR